MIKLLSELLNFLFVFPFFPYGMKMMSDDISYISCEQKHGQLVYYLT